MRAKKAILAGLVILSTLGPFAVAADRTQQTAVEAEILGTTYYLSGSKWVVAPGAYVVGRKGPYEVDYVSEENGYYVLCLSGVPEQDRTGTWLVTASFEKDGKLYCDGDDVYYPGSGKVYHDPQMIPCEQK